MTRTIQSPIQRRQALIQAAEALFLKQGFEGTQVSQIVRQAGASQGTFYNYFSSKEEILGAVFENTWQQFIQAILSNVPASPAAARLRFLLMGIFQPPVQALLEPGHWQALTRLIAHPTAHAIWDDVRMQVLSPHIQQIVNDGVQSGEFKPYTYTPESTQIIFLGVNAYLHNLQEDLSDPQNLARLLTAIQEVLARSLGIAPADLQLYPASHS